MLPTPPRNLLLTVTVARTYSRTDIERWMKLNAQDAWSRSVLLPGYLAIDDVARDQVLCEVMRVDSTVSSSAICSFTLYITATASRQLGLPAADQASPRAILDTFSGRRDDPAAPEWVRWPNPALRFRQPRSTLIGLFSGMALWNENLATSTLSSAMIIWAERISVGTWAQSKKLGPTTPVKRSQPVNTRAHKPCREVLRVHDPEEGEWAEILDSSPTVRITN
ncbi:hypothetical protein MSAN_02376200 [Mycena sanguinolenta]|uniref:Uncharacterized protein n=1 Tax=Mycena sanguinolenta TaxID=230812 RepID=A0A8H6X4L0_9AGAR|nr:hypothetical protein MSAN_02376200 [Mycena sanguinolenta]